MTTYILRRLLLMIPVALLVTVGIFIVIRIAPGDPVLTYAGEDKDPATIAAVRTSLGLDQPLPIQYAAWMSRALQGDLGRSFQTKQRVLEAIGERLPVTLELGLAAILISVTLALVVGILSAVKRNSWVDLLTTSVALAGVSFPNFYLGLVLILIFAYVIPGHILPPSGFVPISTSPGENLRYLILPAVTIATASLAVNLRQVRSSLLDAFGQDYMRTARAKGLREQAVVIRHALKNALIPVVTIVGIQIGAVIEGAFIAETIFSIPGIGRLAVQAIPSQDFPIVQGVVLISALSFMLSTLAVDVLYAFIDPRISFGSADA